MTPPLPVKAEYGPTLGQLLSPRWRSARRGARVLVVAAILLVLIVVIGGALTLVDSTMSHGAPVPFHFSYRDLYRVRSAPPYVRVARRTSGPPGDSFAVLPLTLPSYRGSVTAIYPLYATVYERQLAAADPNFVRLSEGKTRVNTVPAYAINYATRVDGRELDGRDVLLVPPAAGARQGVVLQMLTPASPAITDASPVGNAGVLHLPVRSFTFG